jgi:hypothetical protein
MTRLFDDDTDASKRGIAVVGDATVHQPDDAVAGGLCVHGYFSDCPHCLTGGIGRIVFPTVLYPGPQPVTADDTNPKDRLGAKKPPLTLVPPALLIYTSRVMALGAAKYGPYNWREKKVRLTVYIEAAMRHLMALFDGEDTDPESGMPHSAHAAACMGIILDALATGNLIDDRPTKGAAARLLADLTNK